MEAVAGGLESECGAVAGQEYKEFQRGPILMPFHRTFNLSQQAPRGARCVGFCEQKEPQLPGMAAAKRKSQSRRRKYCPASPASPAPAVAHIRRLLFGDGGRC